MRAAHGHEVILAVEAQEGFAFAGSEQWAHRGQWLKRMTRAAGSVEPAIHGPQVNQRSESRARACRRLLASIEVKHQAIFDGKIGGTREGCGQHAQGRSPAPSPRYVPSAPIWRRATVLDRSGVKRG